MCDRPLVQGNLIGTDATGTVALANGGDGIALAGSSNTIGGTAAGAGNVVSGNAGNGIEIFTGSRNLLQGNYVGTDSSGIRALGNFVGVAIDGTAGSNTVGGTTTGAGNVVSGNRATGVLLASSGNLVQGNYVGTDASGTVVLGNVNGLSLQGAGNTIGGTAAGAGNLISGNRAEGILVFGSSTIIQGNYIGTDFTGTLALGNHNGLSVSSSNNTIGGVEAGAGNLISGNGFQGLVLEAVAQSNQVQGNVIGTDVTGTKSLSSLSGGVTVLGSNNTIGGKDPGASNLISGNVGGVSFIGNGNVLQGNRIGTDATGTQAVFNGVGVSVSGSSNTIGGTTAGAGNLISGNQASGLTITGAGNLVQGNLIGTDTTGTLALGNAIGIFLLGSNNTIGGTAAGAGNVISGGAKGIHLSGRGNRVQGNFIGTDATGTVALGNGDGIYINGSDNLIGGTDPGAGNLISGNLQGVNIQLGVGNVVQGNLIGTDAAGDAPPR